MKPESPFSKLPSLSELLGHPTVAQVVKRVNQTTLAQRATGFLEELQTNLRQRIDQGNVPSLGQLAERLARRLLGPAQTSLPAVNASGTVIGDRWPALPLAEPAVDEVVRLATEYHSGGTALRDRVSITLKELTGAEAVFVVNNFHTACELARAANLVFDQSRLAGLINPQEHGLGGYATINERLEWGTELIVLDGAGLLGGPPCGIIVGKQYLVDQLSYSTLAQLATPHDLTFAALMATLSLYQNKVQAVYQIPVWQLLTAPLENLEQRANRLAMLIDANEQIITATPTHYDGLWCDATDAKLTAPSWAIVVKPLPAAFDSVVNALQESSPQILAQMQQEEIWLDLRGVFPRWDQQLVAAFE
jgi:seryl-tRNA(Sec) selenium transferase